MADSWQITCINKTNGSNTCERIERVGGPDGEGWTLRVDEVIAHINKGASFWVDIGGHRVDVIVTSHSGRAYIKTRSDADSPDNLLSLPECIG
jgi:hypothetical protein